MKFKINTAIFVMAFLMVAVSCRAQSAKVDERGLWDVWCAGTNSAFTASEVLDACKAFKAKTPDDPLAVVVSGFEAWYYLKKGDTAAAVKIFNSMLVEGSATDIRRAGDKMARGWLTRLDRERVAAALKKVYIRDIEFPASLEVLKSLNLTSVPPVTDRWGQPWAYRLDCKIKGMEGQRYVLESSVMGAHSNLKKALAVPYADRINLKPYRMSKSIRNAVEFKTSTGQSVLRQAGDDSNRINLVYLGTYIVILSDGNHWCVLPKPR